VFALKRRADTQVCPYGCCFMKNNDHDHGNRRSIRLKGYDYSLPGYYFVTICVHERAYLFGKIIDGEMLLNEAGHMINKWQVEIPHKFEYICVDSFVVMPNHIHAIFAISEPAEADLCVYPDKHLCVCPNENGEHDEKGRPAGLPLPRVVQWFKTMTTNDYIHGVKHNYWRAFRLRLWQRNYYEHIIRNEEDYYCTREYILSNPKNWDKDKLRDREDCE